MDYHSGKPGQCICSSNKKSFKNQSEKVLITRSKYCRFHVAGSRSRKFLTCGFLLYNNLILATPSLHFVWGIKRKRITANWESLNSEPNSCAGWAQPNYKLITKPSSNVKITHLIILLDNINNNIWSCLNLTGCAKMNLTYLKQFRFLCISLLKGLIVRRNIAIGRAVSPWLVENEYETTL